MRMDNFKDSLPWRLPYRRPYQSTPTQTSPVLTGSGPTSQADAHGSRLQQCDQDMELMTGY